MGRGEEGDKDREEEERVIKMGRREEGDKDAYPCINRASTKS